MPPRKSSVNTGNSVNVNTVHISADIIEEYPVAMSPPPQPPLPKAPKTLSACRKFVVVQTDDRAIDAELQGPMRTWRAADSHAAMRDQYVSRNPPPPERGYWTATAVCNAFQCTRLSGWSARYVRVPAPEGRHASWCKVKWILDSWDSLDPSEAIVLLDSDAWIRDPVGLEHLFRTVDNPCVVAGEPTCAETLEHRSDVMNAGFMCFVKDDAVREYFQAVWDGVEDDGCARYAHDWPREQALQCKAYEADVAGCKAWMDVLPVAACNTPAGTLVSHCWYKELTYALVTDDLLSAVAQSAMSVRRPTLEFVVARFDEDVDWVYEWLPFVDRVTVYNKGEALDIPSHPKITVKASSNVGREAHAYADHLATTAATDLCDVIVCTQARWTDHMDPDAFEQMVKTKTRECNHGLDVAWSSTPMAHFGFTVDANHAKTPMQPSGMSMAKFYLKYVAGESDDIVPESDVDWWHNGIFVVTKAMVTRHAPSKYARIRDAVSAGSNPEASITMERMWKLLLDPKQST